MKHKVACAICGKKGIVNIDDETSRITGRDWYYYKKFNINWDKTEKYLYSVISFEPKLITEKYENKKYDEAVKPKLIEYWECSKCNKE